MIGICSVFVSLTAIAGSSPAADTSSVSSAEIITLSAEAVGERGASSASYGKDSDEIVFMVWPPGSPKMLRSQRTESGWRSPLHALPGFDGLALAPAVSPDGSLLYFESNYRASGSPRRDTDLWVARRTGDEWGDARPLGPPFDSEWQEHNATISAGGTLCFNSSRPNGSGEHDIYCSRKTNGKWSSPMSPGAAINTVHNEGAAYIAPDESYMLFGSDRPGGFGGDDLYISYRIGGVWQPAINLGPGINTSAGEWAPTVAPDGKMLLFTRIVGEGSTARFSLVETRFETRSLLN